MIAYANYTYSSNDTTWDGCETGNTLTVCDYWGRPVHPNVALAGPDDERRYPSWSEGIETVEEHRYTRRPRRRRKLHYFHAWRARALARIRGFMDPKDAKGSAQYFVVNPNQKETLSDALRRWSPPDRGASFMCGGRT